MLPSGIIFKSYAAEGAYLATRPQKVVFALFIVALFLFPMASSAYLLGTVSFMFITMIAVLGLQITVGMAGQINLGQSAFVGVGAYVTAAMAVNYELPFYVAIPIGGLVAGLTSILFGLPAARIKGFYLALTTVAAQVMFPLAISRLPRSWFGGPNGMSMPSMELFGYEIWGQVGIYLVNLCFLLVFATLAFNLQRSRAGRAFTAIRENDVVAPVMGINLVKYKILAFFAGAVFAGISGGLYAYYVTYVTAEQFTLWLSVIYLGMLLIGGMTSPLGAIFGVIIMTLLQETTHDIGGYLSDRISFLDESVIFPATNIVLGAVIIAVLIFEPHGMVRRWRIAKAAYRIWPNPHK